MTNRDKAIQWANEIIESGQLLKPVRINAWEVIEDPILFLKTNISRIENASATEQRLAYNRIRSLKQNL